MSGAKYKMPSDEQIWAEVEARLATFPKVQPAGMNLPSADELFHSRKQWHLDTPKRLAAERKAKEAAKKERADVDEAYIAIRKAQGKPIYTMGELKKKYPEIFESSVKDYTQQELYERADVLEQLSTAKEIRSKVSRVRAITKKLLFEYLTQCYSLYLNITKSEVADRAFDEIRGILKSVYNVNTHYDIPRASLLLKLVFDGAPNKTIHLYTRAFQLADGYDVEPTEFKEFITGIGGLEKIRKAYATVIAADSGKQTLLEKKAEDAASLMALYRIDPLRVFQLTSIERNRFKNDIDGRFCLVLAHIDALNQLEVYGQVKASSGFINETLSEISRIAKDNQSADWLNDKIAAKSELSKNIQRKLVEKEKQTKKSVEKKAKRKVEADKNHSKVEQAAKRKGNE